MRIKVVKIGRPASPHYGSLVDVFKTRLRPFWKIEGIEVKGFEQQVIAKSDLSFLKDLNEPSSLLVAMDERGKEFSSPGLAAQMQKWADQPAVKSVNIVIGGPFGLAEDVRRSAQFVWSLSKAVYPSDLAWLMVWEQLYRASTIIRGTGYHHS